MKKAMPCNRSSVRSITMCFCRRNDNFCIFVHGRIIVWRLGSALSNPAALGRLTRFVPLSDIALFKRRWHLSIPTLPCNSRCLRLKKSYFHTTLDGFLQGFLVAIATTVLNVNVLCHTEVFHLICYVSGKYN